MNYVHTGLEAVDEDEDDEQPEAKKRGRSDAQGEAMWYPATVRAVLKSVELDNYHLGVRQICDAQAARARCPSSRQNGGG